MNRRRPHPAAAAARRARFYRAGRIEEQRDAGDAGERRTSSSASTVGDGTSSHGTGLSGWVDAARFSDVEEAA